MYGLSGLFPYHLILADDERNAKEIYEDYRFYDKNVYFYPAKDLLFFQADIHGNLLIRQRMRVIRALLEQEEVTVVTSIDGCMDFLMPLEKIRSSLLHFKSDSVIDLEKLKADLVELGYEFAKEVLAPGGIFIAKVFQGGAEGTLLADVKKNFAKVGHFKPDASRKESQETYLVAQGYRGKSYSSDN